MYNLFKSINYSLISSILGLSIFISCDGSEDEPENADEGTKETVTYKFAIDDTQYEVVSLNLPWEEAAEYAVDKGGKLAEINSLSEQRSIFRELIDNSDINFIFTFADESSSAKIWIGGSDAAQEGKWIWDGDNNGKGTHFFQGDFFDGDPVDGQYSNWGSSREPDNYGPAGQHALAIGITDWIYGRAGQWNDLMATNRLYFIIEY